MASNNLSFSITARNAASSALTSLQNQVRSLKNGITNIGSSANSANAYLNSLNRGVSSSTKGIGTLGSAIKRTIGIFGGFKIVSGIFNLVSSSMDRAISRMDTMDLFEQKMTMITNSSDQASWALDNLNKSTKGTPYALDIAARSVQNFVTRGMKTKDAVDSINIWMDAVSAYGKGTNEQFESVADALAKMRTKGTVEMRYLNRLFAAGINPVKMYAQATGQSSEAVQEALSAKEIKTDEFLSVVETAMREGTNGVLKVEGMAKELATTWAATTANMGIAIARGVVSLVEGVDKVATLFNENGLKGMVKGFGTTMENVLGGVGNTIGNFASVSKQAFQQATREQLTYFTATNNNIRENLTQASAHFNSAGVRFKEGFFDSFAPYLAQAVMKFEELRDVWSGVAEKFSAGIAQISQPLGRLVGTYLGETVTGIEDIGIAFGNWLNLKLPPFFDKLENVLNWFIEHKDGVINSAKLILKALMGFTVLNTIQNVILSFNDKLKALNNTLAFFTLGKVQLPTLENLVLGNTGGGFAKELKQVKEISSLTQPGKANSLSTIALPTVTPEKNPNKIKNKVSGVVDAGYSYPSTYDIKRVSNKNRTLMRDKSVGQQSLLKNRVASIDKNKKIQAIDLVTPNINYNKNNSSTAYQRSLFNAAEQKALNKNFKSVNLSTSSLATDGLESVMDSRLKSNKSLNKAENELAKYYKKVTDSGFSTSVGESTMANQPSRKGLFTNWIAESFVNSGRAAKQAGSSAYKYVKDSATATGRGTKEVAILTGEALLNGTKNIKSGAGKAASDVVGGFEKFGKVKVGDIADDFKSLGQSTKNVTKKTGSGIASGVGNFFGTMFSGFGGLKKQDKLPKSDLSGAKNLAGGIGSFFGTMFQGFGDLGKGKSAKSAMNLAGEAAEVGVAAEKTGLLATIVEKLKGAFTAAGQAVKTFIDFMTGGVLTTGGMVVAVIGATAAIGALVAGLGVLNPGNKVSDGINKFFTSFGEWCSTIAQNAPILIQNFVSGLIQNLPTLTEQGVNLLLAIVNGILTGIPKLLTVGASLLFSLIGGIAQVLPELLYQGFNAVGKFIAGIIQNLPNILSAGWELIKTIALGIARNLPVIVASAIKMIWSFISGIWSMLSQVGSAIIGLLKDAWNYVTTHPQEIWDAITGFCGELWNALLSGLYAAADMFNAGWLLDALGAVRPEAAEGGADVAQATVDEANQRLSTSALDMKSLIMQGNKEEAEIAAQQAGTDVAGAYVDTVDAEMAQETADFGQYGADAATNYTDNLSSGITAGGANVDQALSSVGAEGLANLQVSFNSEQLAQVGADFMNGLNTSLVTNAPIVYQSVAVFCNNVLTQLEAGLNNPDRAIPQTIADALVSLLGGITQQVNDYVANINTKLTDCYNNLLVLIDNTLNEFANKHTNTINAIFPKFQNDIEAHLTDAHQKYENLSTNVHKTLDALNTYHYTIGQSMMTSLKNGIESTMPQVETVESTLVQKLKDTFEKGMGIHSPADKWIWYGQMLIAGLIQGMQGDKVQSFINNMIDEMNTSFANGNFNADQTVNFLSEQGTLDLIGKVSGLDTSSLAEQQIAYPLAGTLGTISSYFGHRASPGGIGSTNHQGMDLATATGTPILSALAGTVKLADWYGGYGQAVVVDSGNGLEIVYGHMSQILASQGQQVSKGAQIGLVGSTGNSTGPHLHFEMRQNGTAIDPYPYLQGAGIVAGNTLQAVLQQAYNRKYRPELLAMSLSSNNGNVNWDSNSGVAQWTNLVLQALNMLGQPTSLLGAIMATMNKESSGNPNAINKEDINWKRGTPSKGLMQVIDPTFAAYALPGYNTNIWDPLSNILASLRYQLATYGNIKARLNGYAVGSRYIPYDMPAMVHKGEAIIPASQNPYTNSGGDYLAELFNNVFGDSGINSLGFDLSKIDSGSSSNNNINNNLNNVFNIHNDSDVNADRNVGNIESALHKLLQDAMRAGASR